MKVIEGPLGLHSKPVSDLKWNSTGEYLATVSKDKTTKICALRGDGTMKLVHTVPSSLMPVKIAWHPTISNCFAVAGDDKNVDIWDVRAPRASSRLPSLGNNINLSFSPDGKYVACGNSSDNIVVIDVASAKRSEPISFNYEVNEFSWSSNSDHLLVATGCVTGGSQMGGINVISFKDNQLSLVHTLAAHNSNCFSLAVDSKFSACLMGSADFLASMWSLEDLVCRYTIAYESQPSTVAFSGNGEKFCAAINSTRLDVYNSETGEKEQELDLKVKTKLVAWHPTQNMIAYASEPEAVKGQANPTKIKHLRLMSF